MTKKERRRRVLLIGDGGEFTPVDLGTFTGAEMEFEVDRTLDGAGLADMVTHQGQATGITFLEQSLIDLLGTVGWALSRWAMVPLKGSSRLLRLAAAREMKWGRANQVATVL
ncbi:MAG: hypothetical protein WJ306_03730 [Ferrovum myxofaciens]